MIFYETNFCLLLNWSIAHCIAGERMLATFGLTATEIQQALGAAQRAEAELREHGAHARIAVAGGVVVDLEVGVARARRRGEEGELGGLPAVVVDRGLAGSDGGATPTGACMPFVAATIDTTCPADPTRQADTA